MSGTYIVFHILLLFSFLSLHCFGANQCPQSGENYRYNQCKDPIHGNPLTKGKKECIDDGMINHVRSSTKNQIYQVGNLIESFKNSSIRCSKTVERLNETNLTDKIEIYSHEVKTENPVTKKYLEFSTLFHVIRQLHCQLSEQAKECCLDFPNETVLLLNVQLLGKWFNFQRNHGDIIHNEDCEVNIPLPKVNFTFCEEIRDVIYLLLQHVQHTLENSLEVLRPEVLGNV